MDITSLLSSALAGGGAEKLADKLGVDSETAKKMIAVGAPALLHRMQQNASTDEGASALYKALDKHKTPKKNIAETDTNDGLKMLGHIFGGDKDGVAQEVASKAGVSGEQATVMLSALAPVLMGALGHQKASGGLDVGSLTDILGGAKKSVSSGNFLMSLATGLLDKNKDGDIKDDLLNMGMNFLKNKFGSK